MAAGLVGPDARWSVLDHVIEPDAANRATYDSLFELYLDLYPATRSHAWRLADMQLSSFRPRRPMPATKPLCFGGDYMTVECIVGHAEIARRGPAGRAPEPRRRGLTDG